MANQTKNDAPDVAIMTTTAATALNPTAPKALGPTTPPFDFAANGLFPDVGVESPALGPVTLGYCERELENGSAALPDDELLVPVDPVEFVLGVVVPGEVLPGVVVADLLPEGGPSEKPNCWQLDTNELRTLETELGETHWKQLARLL